MKIEDLVQQFAQDIQFDALEGWAGILGVDYFEPPCDDMWPDWEVELRTEIADAMIKIGDKK